MYFVMSAENFKLGANDANQKAAENYLDHIIVKFALYGLIVQHFIVQTVGIVTQAVLKNLGTALDVGNVIPFDHGIILAPIVTGHVLYVSNQCTAVVNVYKLHHVDTLFTVLASNAVFYTNSRGLVLIVDVQWPI